MFHFECMNVTTVRDGAVFDQWSQTYTSDGAPIFCLECSDSGRPSIDPSGRLSPPEQLPTIDTLTAESRSLKESARQADARLREQFRQDQLTRHAELARVQQHTLEQFQHFRQKELTPETMSIELSCLAEGRFRPKPDWPTLDSSFVKVVNDRSVRDGTAFGCSRVLELTGWIHRAVSSLSGGDDTSHARPQRFLNWVVLLGDGNVLSCRGMDRNSKPVVRLSDGDRIMMSPFDHHISVLDSERCLAWITTFARIVDSSDDHL
jgi:hypothetical protein